MEMLYWWMRNHGHVHKHIRTCSDCQKPRNRPQIRGLPEKSFSSSVCPPTDAPFKSVFQNVLSGWLRLDLSVIPCTLAAAVLLYGITQLVEDIDEEADAMESRAAGAEVRHLTDHINKDVFAQMADSLLYLHGQS